jgi:hypothetical protein
MIGQKNPGSEMGHLSQEYPSSVSASDSLGCRSEVVTAQKGTEIFRDNGGRFLVVLKELCYGKVETLEDAAEPARGWRENFVR